MTLNKKCVKMLSIIFFLIGFFITLGGIYYLILFLLTISNATKTGIIIKDIIFLCLIGLFILITSYYTSGIEINLEELPMLSILIFGIVLMLILNFIKNYFTNKKDLKESLYLSILKKSPLIFFVGEYDKKDSLRIIWNTTGFLELCEDIKLFRDINDLESSNWFDKVTEKIKKIHIESILSRTIESNVVEINNITARYYCLPFPGHVFVMIDDITNLVEENTTLRKTNQILIEKKLV